jgi:hypothetical protein
MGERFDLKEEKHFTTGFLWARVTPWGRLPWNEKTNRSKDLREIDPCDIYRIFIDPIQEISRLVKR